MPTHAPTKTSAATREAIAIPLGDREMRLALDQPDPDIEAARQGILKGGNHADDVTAIIWLYRNFHDFSYFERAIELWLVGDKYVMELIDVAGKMRAGIGAGQASAEQVQQWKTEIHAINEKVTPAAKAFSDALGEGSRALLRLLLVANPDHRQRAHPPGVPADPAATDAAPGSGERPRCRARTGPDHPGLDRRRSDHRRHPGAFPTSTRPPSR